VVHQRVPELAWVNDWKTLATRYAGNSTVIGFDLRNEPHTPTGVAYANAATWGTGDPNTDVRLAYQNAGNAILGVDPNALIFCEGISNYPNAAATGGFDTTWWGGNLEGAAQFPVVLSSAGHVVYSAHDYGPDLFQQTWFNSSTTAASLDAVWNKYWGYLATGNTARSGSASSAPATAPPTSPTPPGLAGPVVLVAGLVHRD